MPSFGTFEPSRNHWLARRRGKKKRHVTMTVGWVGDPSSSDVKEDCVKQNHPAFPNECWHRVDRRSEMRLSASLRHDMNVLPAKFLKQNSWQASTMMVVEIRRRDLD